MSDGLPRTNYTAHWRYLDGPQVAVLLVAVEDDVVGHAEALAHSQVVEKRRLAEGVAHLHHGHVCGATFVSLNLNMKDFSP